MERYGYSVPVITSPKPPSNTDMAPIFVDQINNKKTMKELERDLKTYRTIETQETDNRKNSKESIKESVAAYGALGGKKPDQA